jgi:hypothetical protein
VSSENCKEKKKKNSIESNKDKLKMHKKLERQLGKELNGKMLKGSKSKEDKIENWKVRIQVRIFL